MDPGAQQKTMLKNIAQQIKKYPKNNSQIDPKKWGYFGSGASLDTFGGRTRFGALKMGPGAPKVLQMFEK